MNEYFTTGLSVANSDAIDCSYVMERLGEYVDGELSEESRESVDLHLDECVECTAFLASYKHVIEAASELREPEVAVPVEVQNRLRSALNQRLGIKLPLIA